MKKCKTCNMEIDGSHSDFTCARWRGEWDKARVAAVVASPAFVSRMNVKMIAAVIGESVERTEPAIAALVANGVIEEHEDYSRRTGDLYYGVTPWLQMMGDLLGEFQAVDAA